MSMVNVNIDHSHPKYSPNGLCPLCGCEVKEKPAPAFDTFNKMVEGLIQSCPCCDWQSDVLYDE